MHDYQLERLNTRSFEQLVQSLSLKILGSQITIFGDGPDGGREATFRGLVNYPEGNEPWNGYGIVQAKFKQATDPTEKSNTQWALKQLKAELKKFKPKPRNQKALSLDERYCPDFYVFVTNVSLTPVLKKGGKDRVRAELEAFKKSHGLIDYAIWDGDQIRRFLDLNPDIRMTYSAWLLPGDVLGEVIKQLRLNEADFGSTMLRFLASELLDDQYAKLGQGGYTEANTIPLSNVFVDLPVVAPVERLRDPEWIACFRKTNASREERERRLTFLELFSTESRQALRPSLNTGRLSADRHSRRTAGRMVLIGGPGQGKTTVGQFACQLLRVALLKAASSSHSPEVTQAIQRIDAQTQGLPVPQVLRYPLRIDLKRLAEAIAGQGDYAANSVLDFLVKFISKRTDTELRKSEFRQWLGVYPWVLVLDGLDEVPASSNRKEVMKAIRDFVGIEAQQQDADILILATTRPQGYSEEFDPTLYCHLTLAPLKADEALNYGTKLAQARHPGLTSRVESLCASLKRATTNPATVRIMESPLQVTIMLALIEGGGEPPEQRWKLFHDYYDVIYRREKERGTSFSPILGRYEPDINWIHHRAGWILQQRNAVAGATAARLTHAEFEELVDKRLDSKGHKVSSRQQLVKQIREAATDRLVFLVGNTSKEIGFEIRSLQEFMAAEHCFDGRETCVQETIRVISEYPYWRNVLLFIAGRIFFEKETLIDSIIATCERLNETLNDRARGGVFAGSRLALAILYDGPARNQPDNTRLLARCAAHLIGIPSHGELEMMVSLFQGEAAEVWKDEIFRRLQTSSNELSRELWSFCLRLALTDNAWAVDLFKQSFPWDDPGLRRELDISIGYRTKIGPLMIGAVKANIFKVPPPEWPDPGPLPEALRIPEVKQLSRIRNPPGPGLGIHLVDDNGKRMAGRVFLKGSEILQEWAALKIDLKSEPLHAAWKAYHFVSEFARMPTLPNLAKQMQNLFALNFDFLNENDCWTLPWQIHAGLTAKANAIPEAAIVEAIKCGNFGSPNEWIAWENLSKMGLKLSSLSFAENQPRLSVDYLGPAFDNASFEYVERDAGLLSEIIVAGFPVLKLSSRLREQLLHMCVFEIVQSENRELSGAQKVLFKLIEALRKCGIAIPREIVAASISVPCDTRYKIELLSNIQEISNTMPWVGAGSRFSATASAAWLQIIEELGESERLIDVIVPLSFFPNTVLARRIPASILDRLRLEGGHKRESAIALRGFSLQWSRDDANQLADEIWMLEQSRPNYIRQLLELIDDDGVYGDHLESFLLHLLGKSADPRGKNWRAVIFGALVRVVERRPPTNSLPDPSIRSEFISQNLNPVNPV